MEEERKECVRLPISVKGVVLKNGKVLLLKNEREEWELPGGKLELGESPPECLAREIEEETGLKVVPSIPIDNWVYAVFPGVHVFICVYACGAPRAGTFKISDEHKEGRWFPLAAVDSLPMPQGYKDSIHLHDLAETGKKCKAYAWCPW